ncbi:MAG: TonB family protein, partial [Myxococcota bacterium]|nr:TonB family protein [Myxococcota bacterium]
MLLITPAQAQAQDPPADADSSGETETAAGDPGTEELPEGLTPPVLRSSLSPPVPANLLPPGGPIVEVILTLEIDDEGSVIDWSVTTSSGYPELDEAVLAVAPLLDFYPARYEGRPVSVSLTFPFRFFPETPPPPKPEPARLEGRVETRGSKEPVPFQSLTLISAEPKPEDEQVKPKRKNGIVDETVNYILGQEDFLSVESDENGRFVFDEVPPGTWAVVVGSGGFRIRRWIEVLEEGVQRDVVYRLTPTLSNETVVIGQRDPTTPERELSRD